MTRIEILIDDIEKADAAYWRYGVSSISDDIYESWRIELKNLDPKNSILTRINTVVVKSSGKVIHPEPMLSLDKKYKELDILKWMNKVSRNNDEQFIFSPKWDGIAIKNYPQRILTTRGDGFDGEDISDKKRLIIIWDSQISNGQFSCEKILKFSSNRFLQQQIIHTESLETIDPSIIRVGELVISKNNFEKYFKSGQITKGDGTKYENIRNVVAGIMNRDNIKGIPSNIFTMITYGCYNDILPLKKITEETITKYQQFVKTLDFETDGSVIKLADEKYGKTLGATSHHYRHSMAFKHANIGKPSKCIDIKLHSGKRKLTPVAIYNPIEIDGVICQKATLHNWKNVIDKDIYIGDTLYIERAGKVIPKVITSIPNPDTTKRLSVFDIDTCPCCGSSVKYVEPDLYCSNEKCTDIIVQRLVYAVKSLGVKNVSDATISQLHESFNVENILDIYKITKNQLLCLDGWQESSTNNFLNELKRVKDSKITEYDILTSLCIDGIGKSTYKTMCNYYKLNDLMLLNVGSLVELPDIGKTIADRFIIEIDNNYDYLKRLIGFFDPISSLNQNNNNSSQKSICFTGKFPKAKKNYEDLAKTTDYVINKSVTKLLDILVIPNDEFTSTKVKKALKYKISIINIDNFLQEFNGN